MKNNANIVRQLPHGVLTDGNIEIVGKYFHEVLNASNVREWMRKSATTPRRLKPAIWPNALKNSKLLRKESILAEA